MLIDWEKYKNIKKNKRIIFETLWETINQIQDLQIEKHSELKAQKNIRVELGVI
jgi:uncharacterized FlgJ-related protein